MLKFERIKIQDREEFINKLREHDYHNSEFSFGNIFIWKDGFDIELCHLDGVIYIRGLKPDEKCRCMFQPIVPCNRDIRQAVDMIHQEFQEMGCQFRISTANQQFIDRMIAGGITCLNAVEDRAMFDYVYKTEDLANLAGKRYHKKRTHINKFNRDVDYQYKELTKEHKADCIQIFQKWLGNDEDAFNELSAIHNAFDYFHELEFSGGILYINDMPVAFTIGEQFRTDTALIHLEKVDPEFRNAYQVINQLYAHQWLGKVDYINREEDMGIPGLRKAKESYYPCRMVKKFDITWSCE